MAWQVEFFTDERGEAPVEEYLTSLPVQHRAKMLALPQDAGAGRTESAVSVFFAGPREAEGAAKSTREGQGENSLFRRREEGVCAPARNRKNGARNCRRGIFA